MKWMEEDRNQHQSQCSKENLDRGTMWHEKHDKHKMVFMVQNGYRLHDLSAIY